MPKDDVADICLVLSGYAVRGGQVHHLANMVFPNLTKAQLEGMQRAQMASLSSQQTTEE